LATSGTREFRTEHYTPGGEGKGGMGDPNLHQSRLT
jgi:hypothetical protein